MKKEGLHVWPDAGLGQSPGSPPDAVALAKPLNCSLPQFPWVSESKSEV